MKVLKQHLLKPLFKYPGGKSSEYKYLKKLFPLFSQYVEPFLGGGAVYWATSSKNWVINDFSQELIAVYKLTQVQDKVFLGYVNEISAIWTTKNKYVDQVVLALSNAIKGESFELSEVASKVTAGGILLHINHSDFENELNKSVSRKVKSLARVASHSEIKNLDENALGVLGSAVYTYLRKLYNSTAYSKEPELKSALYLFLREYSYSSMFRFNSSGCFNVPFGGNSYAKKDFSARYQQITSQEVITKLLNTDIRQGDFSGSLIDEKDTFIFLDPPYDSEFSTYNLHVFDAQEQIRLRNSLLKIKKSKWLMVIKSTEFVEELYDHDGWYKIRFDKNYSVNFKNRNNQSVEHLVITNYNVEELLNGNI